MYFKGNYSSTQAIYSMIHITKLRKFHLGLREKGTFITHNVYQLI